MLQHSFLPTLPSLLMQPGVPLIHRDLSWLQFNERVLAEARAASNPLLERAKFLAISASNLDEFFMIRVASLERSMTTAERRDPEAGKRLRRIHGAVLEAVAKFGAKQAEALDLLAGELEAAGIFIVRAPRPGSAALELSKKVFDEQVLHRLSPPEPFAMAKLGTLENLQLAAWLGNGNWVRVPKQIPVVLLQVMASNGVHLFFLDDLLATHLGAALGAQGEPAFLRITRDGDFTVDLEEEDPESIPDVVRTGLGSRERGRPIRLQYWGEFQPGFLEDAAKALKLEPAQVLPAPHTLGLQGLWTVVNQCPEELARKEGLRYPPLKTAIPAQLSEPARIFENLKKGDVLLHHPYDAFDGFVTWIHAACDDPAVTMIEQTVYRMDVLSRVIEALKSAAGRGKKVRVIIELRARFDELNNLLLAEELRKAGVEVAFGFGNLKLHAKIALVTRDEEGGPRLYTHLSTGNYNATTARQYTDLAILTAHPEVGADAKHFLDSVWKGEIPMQFKHLVSAPARLHRRLINHIEHETEAARSGKKARIVAKVNALVDGAVVEQLYKASQAGVQVELIVRGACSLIPGVPGLSENIRVVSIVDRFLEHSRIYYFESSGSLYLSSADWMPRNFFSRLEIAFPILDPRLHDYISNVVIPLYLADTVKAKELTPQGTWKKRSFSSLSPAAHQLVESLFGRKPVRSQFLFEELAGRAYRGTPIGDPAQALSAPGPEAAP